MTAAYQALHTLLPVTLPQQRQQAFHYIQGIIVRVVTQLGRADVTPKYFVMKGTGADTHAGVL